MVCTADGAGVLTVNKPLSEYDLCMVCTADDASVLSISH